MTDLSRMFFRTDILTQTHLLYILMFVFVLFVIVSVIFYYHWRKYSNRTSVMVIAETTYLTVGSLLFALALIIIGIW